ncbi:hypothetical protein L1987_60168 [Smallanthus sonchifolius]|uniref:Uncharacterized protein n=1 Tax=Smallanthus sonchifolius TaxID=185202 RepID=A0ACB9D7C3_9ASTR|nr:hypothetical protein L1987_60168 [Smallanthus sonchifolius]
MEKHHECIGHSDNKCFDWSVDIEEVNREINQALMVKIVDKPISNSYTPTESSSASGSSSSMSSEEIKPPFEEAHRSKRASNVLASASEIPDEVEMKHDEMWKKEARTFLSPGPLKQL